MARPALATTSTAQSTSISYSHAEYSQSSSRSTSASSVFSDTPVSRPVTSAPGKKPKRLALHFDGTGNVFNGNTSDTNVVKIFDKLNRNDELQYHYYQTGIGTYEAGGASVNKTFLGGVRSSVSKTLDQGFATTFDAHVMSGYRFLMQYYENGDKIYMFGFSRGAFTARFLSRMVGAVGLLSRGNDEMIPFAYKLYQDYVAGKQSGDKDSADVALAKLKAFQKTFCRQIPERAANGTITYRQVECFFLGIFDCVGSVAVLESPFGKPPAPVEVVGHAKHVRHAVAVDERRVKFKAALLAQEEALEKDKAGNTVGNAIEQPKPLENGRTSKEVWFPGNHGDVGGGWEAPVKPATDAPPPSAWKKFKQAVSWVLFGEPKQIAHASAQDDAFQMSDMPLAWMIRELENLPEPEETKLSWNPELAVFKRGFEEHVQDMQVARKHDTMALGGGSPLIKALFWQLLEHLPLMPRLELVPRKDKKDGMTWERRKWMPNLGATRDIPTGALLHRSVIDRLRNAQLKYAPRNNHGDGTVACLNAATIDESITQVPYDTNPLDPKMQDEYRDYHTLYQLK